MRVRIARDELRRIRELSQTIKALEARDRRLVATIAPQLTLRAGVRTLDGGQARRRDRRRQRFATAAKLARAAGVAPIPASSGNTHDNASTRAATARSTPRFTASSSPAPAATPQPGLHRPRRAEGKTTREAIRCLKRYLARHVWRLLQPPHPDQGHRHHHQFLDIEATKPAAVVAARFSRGTFPSVFP
jgi:hypothetical protein